MCDLAGALLFDDAAFRVTAPYLDRMRDAPAIPRYGFVGATATSSLAYALMLALCLACYLRKPLPPRGDA